MNTQINVGDRVVVTDVLYDDDEFVGRQGVLERIDLIVRVDGEDLRTIATHVLPAPAPLVVEIDWSTWGLDAEVARALSSYAAIHALLTEPDDAADLRDPHVD